MPSPPPPPDPELLRIAEAASAGVRHHLARRETLIAAALQPFAAAAWAAAHGELPCAGLHAEAARALARLRDVVGAGRARGFLADAADVLATRPAHGATGSGRTAPGAAPVGRPTDFDGLRALLRAHGGVLSVRTGLLRDLAGAARLTPAVRSRIAAALGERGIASDPSPPPARAVAWVRLHLRSHPLAVLLEGVATPGPEGDDLIALAAVLLADDGGV